jgi:Flp pilus assembly pilin Flp
MKLFKLAKTFRNDEDGAVTVDWVVLTAAIVGLGIAVYGVVSGGIQNLSQDIDTQLETDQINTTFGAAPAPS